MSSLCTLHCLLCAVQVKQNEVRRAMWKMVLKGAGSRCSPLHQCRACHC